MHEANLESNDITFRGFPWVLRLRHVMSHASNLDEVSFSVDNGLVSCLCVYDVLHYDGQLS